MLGLCPAPRPRLRRKIGNDVGDASFSGKGTLCQHTCTQPSTFVRGLTDERAEAQRDEAVCPRSHRGERPSPRVTPGSTPCLAPCPILPE